MISGYDKKTREHQINNLFFTHNCFGSFFSGVLNWFSDEFYPRFNYKLLGTYDKSVEYFKRKKELGTDVTTNILPSITLDPMLDFSNEERGGKFLWQFSRYAPGIGVRLWNSIDLKEQDILITPVFSRYQGTFEITFWLSSIYELMDFRVSLLQFCGGFQRWCRPEVFWTYLILPENTTDYQKDDGSYIDWGNTLSDIIQVESINKQKRVVPIELSPMWRLESFSDSSTKYGNDTIAEYKLSASFSYEINLPTYIVVSDNVDPSLSLNLSLGNSYSKYPLVSPYKIVKAIENKQKSKQFLESNYNYFQIEDDELEKEKLFIEFSSDSISFPDKVTQWNYINYGELVYVDESFIQNGYEVERGQIVLIDSYKDSYLPYIRKAGSVINCIDTKSTIFYDKCRILKKPCICLINEEEKQKLLEKIGSIITLDTRRKRAYDGPLDVICLDEDDPKFSFEILKNIQKTDPELYEEAISEAKENEFPYHLPEHKGTEYIEKMSKRLICDYTNGFDSSYFLPFVIDQSSVESLLVYVNDELVTYGTDYTVIDGEILKFIEVPEEGSTVYISGELLVIKESKLIAIYEYTQEDIDSTENIIVELPKPVNDKNDIVLISYTGKLEYDRDYDIDLENNLATIKIKPVIDEIIEIFYYM